MAITLELDQLVLRHADLRVVDRGRRARLAASLAAEGQREPVLVVQEGDQYVLIDGYERVAALGKLAEDTVQAVVIDVEEVDALVLAWRLQRSRRRSAIEDGWLVCELVEGHGLSQVEVARRLQRSKGWISERLALVNVLPEEVQEAVRTGQIAARGAMRFLVPMARRSKDHCVRLVAGLNGERLSVDDIERLYKAWLDVDAALRDRIGWTRRATSACTPTGTRCPRRPSGGRSSCTSIAGTCVSSMGTSWSSSTPNSCPGRACV
jgi:ParB family chromosome partitioning protein